MARTWYAGPRPSHIALPPAHILQSSQNTHEAVSNTDYPAYTVPKESDPIRCNSNAFPKSKITVKDSATACQTSAAKTVNLDSEIDGSVTGVMLLSSP